MYSRPKPEETDEDLLRMQEEFLKNENKIKLAATVISENKKASTSSTINTEENCIIDIQEQIANTFEAIPNIEKIGNVVENNNESNRIFQFQFNRSRGFPQAKRRDANFNAAPGKSIFAQHMKKIKLTNESMDHSPTSDTITIKENSEIRPVCEPNQQIPTTSNILSDPESREIHEENLNKLKAMPEQEILEERKRLMATMDPALIAFLKARRNTHSNPPKAPSIREQNEAVINIEDIETPNELLRQPAAEKWLNFDRIETNKLAWMKDVILPKFDKNKSFEARFDFEGWLLPYSDQMTEKNRTLYHHGEEAGRPGYTLQELFQLSRSEVIQQKIIALNSIANLLSLNSTGVYCDIVELPIEQIFFVLRFCLDDNSPAILNASIRAMRNLIFNKIDETCLDCLLGFGLGQIQPTLAVDDANEDDETVNDQQLAETNLIKCLARTDILTRIRYIINTVQPSIETVVYCMDILTRLVRDSQFIMTKVYNCENLIKSIITNFVPKVFITSQNNSAYGLPLLQAVKFLRILSCRSKFIATELVEKFSIMDSLMTYLSSETYSVNANGLKLQTETLNLWSVFVQYNLTLDCFQILTPILMELLNYHYKNTNLDIRTTYIRQGNVAALFNLIECITKNNFSLIKSYLNMIINCFNKWCCQFNNLEEFTCGKLQMISSVFSCIASIYKYGDEINHSIDELSLKLITSMGFEIVTKNIKNGSMFLNNYETLQSSANMKTLETAAWYSSEHIIPLIQRNSPLPFLSSFSMYLEISNDYNVKLSFLKHTNISQYIESLIQSDKYYLTNNWFAKYEANFVMNILKCSIVTKNNLDTSSFYELAVKCLSTFHSEQKQDIEKLLQEIVFCSKFYPSEVLLKNLEIDRRNETFIVSLNNLDDIQTVYTNVLGLKSHIPNFTSNLSVDVKIGNVIPIDWIYTPIIVLYSNKQQNKTLDEVQQIFIIKNCLRWILIYETYFSKLAASINPTDRFCRIACVFLGSDSLFLNSEIHNLLELCLKNVISKCENEINFDKEIQGLTNFYDLYTQLLEQYQGVSYGDVLFGNFLLVPLAQRQNIQFRKTLWSEYIGVVQIFNVTPEQTISSMDLFLEPNEDDLSLLKCYRRALASNIVRSHSVLYKIAKHHVEKYIKRNK